MSELLSVRQLTRRFGGLTAVNGVSFDLGAGEILGLIGPNGAGKTTLFNLLTGLCKPSAGSVSLDGRSLAGLRPNRVCRLGMVKTFQNVALFPEMSVRENVLTGALLRHPVAAAGEIAMQQLERVGMARIADKLARDLSFPERALVELARALCTGPRVVLLDEVMAALNESEMDDILALIRSLRDREGLSFIVIEHHMRAIMRLCDRIIVLNFGQKIADDTPARIAADTAVIDAYLGDSALEHIEAAQAEAQS